MRDARLLLATLRLAPSADRDALVDAWSRTDAGPLVRLAAFEGVELWLSRRLKTLDISLEGEPRRQLDLLARRAVAQSMRVDAEASAALGALADAGIPAVPLKGTALRCIAARVPYADARASADVDVLVTADAARRAWDVLTARGYTSLREAGPADGHHLPALVGSTGVAVELHITTMATVTPAEAWRRATSDHAGADRDAVARPIPSDTELLWHAVAHALLDAEDAARIGVRLRYWLDAAALIGSGSELDWQRIRARLDSAETPRPTFARAWLLAAAWLSGRPLPDEALGRQPTTPFDLERLVAWRLRVFAGAAPDGRWAVKLVEEGARGEAGLPAEPSPDGASALARVRHAVAARAARLWWTLRR